MSRFDPYRPITGDPAAYLKNESAFMTPENFYRIEDNFRKRQAAIHTLVENKNTTDAFVPYLAMSYFDLYFTHHGTLMIRDNMRGEIELLAKTCLFIAQRARNVGVEKLRNPIGRKVLSVAERLVVGRLAEKLAVVSPLAFAPHHSACFHQDLPLAATVIIVETQDDARFSFFRPSVVSAAAVLVAMFHMSKANMARLGTLVNSFGGIDRDQLRECFILVAQMCKRKNLLRPHAKVAHSQEKGLCVFEPFKGSSRKKFKLEWSPSAPISLILSELDRVKRLSVRLANLVRIMDEIIEGIPEDVMQLNGEQEYLRVWECYKWSISDLVVRLITYR